MVWRVFDGEMFKLNIDVGKFGDWGYGWGVVIRNCNGEIEVVVIV